MACGYVSKQDCGPRLEYLSKFAMIQWAVVAIEVEFFSNDFELEKQQKDKMCQSLEQNFPDYG